jgi:hypothetical protein
MFEIDAHKFVGLTNTLRSVTNMGRLFPERIDQGGMGDRGMADGLRADAEMLAEMNLSVTRSAWLTLAETIGSYGPYNNLANARVGSVCEILHREMEGRKFLQIDRDDIYSGGAALFGPDVATNFASGAAFEIDEAAKCLALGRSTAAVFHLMRVMEIGVRSACACLGIPGPTGNDRNWGNMLRALKTEMESRNKQKPPRWNIPTDPDFFGEIHVSLDAVKNVWRNATMHVENKYTPEEADHIFGAVRGFMRKLASRCDEQGLPLA